MSSQSHLCRSGPAGRDDHCNSYHINTLSYQGCKLSFLLANSCLDLLCYNQQSSLAAAEYIDLQLGEDIGRHPVASPNFVVSSHCILKLYHGWHCILFKSTLQLSSEFLDATPPLISGRKDLGFKKTRSRPGGASSNQISVQETLPAPH